VALAGRGRAWLAGALVVLSLSALVPGVASAAARPPAPAFRTHGLWIQDQQGRDLFLRGFDLTGGEDTPTTSLLPYGPATFSAIRDAGASVVRLPIAWALIEPTPGHIDPLALARARQIVQWASAAGLKIVLDMHQYLWAPCFGGNGIPDWAVPNCPSSPPTSIVGQEADDLIAENAFWHSPSLQADFAGAWVAVARAVGDPPGLLGYDLLNEPGPGLIPNELFETDYLAPFYRMVGSRLRALHEAPLLFVEPSILNGLVNGSSQFLGPIGLPDLVYEPHQYGAVSFNADSAVGVADLAGPPQFLADLTIDQNVASRIGAALWLGEWGAINPVVSLRPDNYVDDDLDAQDLFLMGSAYWSFDSSAANAPIMTELTRIAPAAIGGTPIAISTGSALTMTWRSDGAPTLIDLPIPCHATVEVSGGPSTSSVETGSVTISAARDEVLTARAACS
jgi:endoglycosylceramidase